MRAVGPTQARAGSAYDGPMAAAGRMKPDADARDAVLWLTVACLLLGSIPIGFVSNDGAGHSASFVAGSWRPNPNHLLFEPLGAGWQATLLAMGVRREPYDVLKLLSVVAGALALAIFRWAVAPAVAGSRLRSNLGTAWMAGSSAFLRLWISDETHIIQMPALAAAVALALAWHRRPSTGRAFSLGVAIGVATLTFVSNALIGAAIAAALVTPLLGRATIRRGLFTAGAIGAGVLLTAGPLFALAWASSAEGRPFLAWLTRYGESTASARVIDAYGVTADVRDLLLSAARACYGAASALVDITSLGAAVRDGRAPTAFAIAAGLALLVAVAVMAFSVARIAGRRDDSTDRFLLRLTTAYAAAVLLFGLGWNNSDDQFYVQLAVLFGLVVARMPAHPLGVVASLAVLLWNAADVGTRRVFYPRQERAALLRQETAGACLALVPGFDEAELLLAISPGRPVPRLSITQVAMAHPPAEGLVELRRRVEACKDAPGPVVVIDVFDTLDWRAPWKFLLRLGYSRAEVETVLSSLALSPTRRVGPFTIRSTRGGSPARRPRARHGGPSRGSSARRG